MRAQAQADARPRCSVSAQYKESLSANGCRDTGSWYRRGRRVLVGEGRVIAVLNASAGTSRRATALLGLGALRSLFQLVDRNKGYWYRRGTGSLLAKAGPACDRKQWLFQLMGRSTGYWYRRGPGCLWARGGSLLGALAHSEARNKRAVT
jgi:hypothetical protein